MKTMPNEIAAYNQSQSKTYQKICNTLRRIIDASLPKAESKIWHRGPVWFLDGNPVAGYWKRKQGVELIFWSGVSFQEPVLLPIGNKFKAAAILYTDHKQIQPTDVKRWLRKSKAIQWDYKNIVKRKGRLVRLR